MRRRRERARQIRNRTAAAGLALALGALLLGLSHLPGATGVPVLLAHWQRRLLGVAAPALPIYIFLAGLVLVAAGDRARFSRRVTGILLGSLTALILVHAYLSAGDPLKLGTAGAGTGLVGGSLAWLIVRTLGTTGLWVAIGVMALASTALITGLTMASVGAGLRAASLSMVWVVVVIARLLGALGRLIVMVSLRLWTAAARAAVRAMRAAWAALGQIATGGVAWVVHLLVKTRHALLQRQAASEPIPAPAGPPLDLVTTASSRAESSSAAGATGNAGVDGESDTSSLDSRSPEPGVRDPEGLAAAAAARLQDRRRARRPAQKPGSDDAQERLDFSAVEYRLPPLATLGDTNAARGKTRVDPADTARALEQTLESFGVKVKVVHWEVGPVVTRFEIQPEPGVKVQKITSLTNDIALNLAAQSVRIEAPIPGKSAVGIELPNQKASLVHLREILTAEVFQKATSPLVVAIGKDIAGHPIVADLTEMPHVLIAGATGSGKSVMLNAMIASMLFRSTPRQVRLVMIDPKRVELTDYNDIPHLLTPVVTNPRQAASVLKDMLRVMEQRFELFAQAGARNIQSYNQLPDVEPLYYIVIIIDELADLMMIAPADFEDIICRLAQMTRATGIHLVLATQRPSVDVITGLIKANIPSRLAFAVSSQVDSRTILDATGAEKLLGRGDMLFLPLGASRAIRAQGAYIADDEIRAVVEWWRRQGMPVYDQQLVQAQQAASTEESTDGERLIEAARLIVRSGYGSVSLLQRKMRIGYVTAARLIDELEARGIVGPVQGSNPREVLIGLEDLERMLRARSAAKKG
ncbi:MAG: DNA translocase FtsK [Armatimonadota bacterium]